jgi:16S rRNA (uracil1498-N3)-methyltransferase
MPSADLLVRASATAQILVEHIDEPVVASSDLHHLTKVLRVRNGESVIATDGRGAWRACAWRDGLIGDGEVQREDEPSRSEIAFALTKGDKPEWTVQKLTEIGVTRIVPFVSERTIVKWDTAKAQKNVERFQRIAHEAAMQSRRVWLPTISSVATFDEIIADDFALAAPGENSEPQAVDKIAVGPEGGWSEAELQRARSRVSLGSTILRAETACLVAAVRIAQKI